MYARGRVMSRLCGTPALGLHQIDMVRLMDLI
jgi:hypothetical protein